MNKPSILCFFIFLFCFSAIHAQEIKLGIKGKKAEGELSATDPTFPNNKNHYKNIPFTLKAGQGVVLYMRTSAFLPNVVLLSNDRKYFGTQRIRETENGKEARVAFIAQSELYPNSKIFSPRDTSFQVIFTSQEENATGKYSYGYKLIDSLQMIYDSHSFCSRLGYLINQWQADWDLIPESIFNQVPHPDNITKYTLVPDETGSSLTTGSGFIGPSSMDKKASYTETMFSSSTDRGGDFFAKIIKDIKDCLGETNWVFEWETQDDEEAKREILHIYVKGAAKDKPHQSFKVIWFRPFKLYAFHEYEVYLIFN